MIFQKKIPGITGPVMSIIGPLLLALMFTPYPTYAENKGTCTIDAKWLIPTPKKASLGKLVTLPSHYYFDDAKFSIPPNTKAWIRDDLRKKTGWRENQSPKGACAIKTVLLKPSRNNEYYTLTVSANSITLGAASRAGLYRAIGRLLCIIDSPLVTCLPDGSLRCPEITLSDWPDFPRRGMELQMSFKVNVNEDLIKKEVNALARLGFNFVVYEIGGRFESLKHPECSIKPWWTQKQLKDLMAYAKNRGLTPIPAINSIGHLERAPQIYPIWGPNKKMKHPVIMDLSNPNFYNVYFDILDELSAIFEHPPYFHIGTDEFVHYKGVELLERATGESGDVAYAKFLNKAYRHLTKKNIKMVVWHDMLADPKKPHKWLEPAKGAMTWKAINNINKHIIINYWCYMYLKDYEILDRLVAKGFTVWASPWRGEKAIEGLCSQAHRLGIKTILGTTWGKSPFTLFAQTGEMTWNISGHHTCDYEAFHDSFFHCRGTKQIQTVSQISNTSGLILPSASFLDRLKKVFPDMKMDASGIQLQITNPREFFLAGITPPPAVQPQNFKKYITNGDFKNLLIYAPKQHIWFAPTLGKFNTHRNTNYCVIYTPAYGNSTRTNNCGIEAAVRNGKIIRISRNGNMRIPSDGFVISKHGGEGRTFWETLKVGDRLALLLRNPSQPPVEPISLQLLPKKRNLILFLTTEYPIDITRSLGKVEVVLSDGTKRALNLRSRSFFARKDTSGWRNWVAWSENKELNKIQALEWKAPKGEKAYPTSVKVTASPEGVQSGLTVLGGIQY